MLKARTVTVGVRKESKEGEKMTDTGKESLTSSTLTSNFYGDGDRGESIMELVTELIIQNVHNFTIFNQLLQIFEGLLQFSSLDEGLMNRSIKAIVE